MPTRLKDKPVSLGVRKSTRRLGKTRSANSDQLLDKNGFPQLTPKQQAEADSLNKPFVFGTRVFAFCDDDYFYSAVVMRDSVDGRSYRIKYVDGSQERTLSADSIIPLACLQLEDQITVSKSIDGESWLFCVAISQKPSITDHAKWSEGNFEVDELDDENKKTTNTYSWTDILISQEQKEQFLNRYNSSAINVFNSEPSLDSSPISDLKPTQRRSTQKRKRKTLISDEVDKNDSLSDEEVPTKQRKHNDQVLGLETLQVLSPDTNILPPTDSGATNLCNEENGDMLKKEIDVANEQTNLFQQPRMFTEFVAQEESNLPFQQEDNLPFQQRADFPVQQEVNLLFQQEDNLAFQQRADLPVQQDVLTEENLLAGKILNMGRAFVYEKISESTVNWFSSPSYSQAFQRNIATQAEQNGRTPIYLIPVAFIVFMVVRNLSEVVCSLIGILYPLICTYEMLQLNQNDVPASLSRHWIQYWCIFGVFTGFDFIGRVLPFYSLIKASILSVAAIPSLRLSNVIFSYLVRPVAAFGKYMLKKYFIL